MKEKHLLIILTFLFFILSVKPQINEESVYLSSLNNYTSPLNKVRKEIIDKALKSLPKREEVDELKMALTMKNAQQEYSLNEAESAYLIYKWIQKNIHFNCTFKSLNDETTTYNNGKGSYYGIAHIFITMCKILGLKANYIEGYTIELGFVNDKKLMNKFDYGWNSVIIDNKYYLLDVIGELYYEPLAGCMGLSSDYYFCSYPEHFVRFHFPLDSKWQLLTQTIDLETFLSQTSLYYSFFRYGFKSISPDKSILKVNNTLKIVIINENPDTNYTYLDFRVECKFCRDYSEYDDYYLVSNIKERTEIDVIFNGKRQYLLEISLSNKDNVDSKFADYIINNEIEQNPPLHFPIQFFFLNGLKLIEPLYSPLKRGETIYFKILFESANELIIEDNKNKTTLTKEGNLFTGNFFINDIEYNEVSIYFGYELADHILLFIYQTN